MTILKSMLLAHPRPPGDHLDTLADAAEALARCEQICVVCADACLAEESVDKLRLCIQLSLECAEICGATARLVLRHSAAPASALPAQLDVCLMACQACADHCELHGTDLGHCAICADTCRECQEKCNAVLGELALAAVGSTD
jgi:hypothetical protein